MVTALPESIEQRQKRKKIRLDNRDKREQEHTAAVRVLLVLQSAARTERNKRESEARASRDTLRRKFLSIVPTSTLEGKGKEKEVRVGHSSGKEGEKRRFCDACDTEARGQGRL